MVTAETSRALTHETTVGVGLPAMATFFWFILGLLSVDPPFMYYGLAVGTYFLAIEFDNRNPEMNTDLNALMVRAPLVIVWTIVGLIVNGLLGAIIAPSTPKGPFTALSAFMAFNTVLSVSRAGLIIYNIFDRFDVAAIGNYFQGNGNAAAPPAAAGGGDNGQGGQGAAGAGGGRADGAPAAG